MSLQIQAPLVREVPISYGSQLELEIHFNNQAKLFTVFLDKVNLATFVLPSGAKPAFKSLHVTGGIQLMYLGQMTPGIARLFI